MGKLKAAVVWFLMRVSRVECSLDDIVRRRYGHEYPAVPNPPPDRKGEGLVELARHRFEMAEQRHERLNGKVNMLLTVAGVVLALGSVFVGRTASWYLAVPAFVSLAASVFLMLEFLGVSTIMCPVIDDEMVGAEGDARSMKIMRDYLLSAVENDRQTDFLVDVYRAARNWFEFGMVLLLLAYLLGQANEAPADGDEGRPQQQAPATPTSPAK